MPPRPKRTTEEIEESAPIAVAKPNETLIAVTVADPFSDGNLLEFMQAYGYENQWRPGEVRNLPMWLINRVRSSGGEIEKVD